MPVKLNVNLMCELVLDYKLVVFKENLIQMNDQFVFTMGIKIDNITLLVLTWSQDVYTVFNI